MVSSPTSFNDRALGSAVVGGRYALRDPIAAGGMATVHLGRLLGQAGFARTVAIKRLHPHLLSDPTFGDMFVDEARLAARIRHPNVVPTLDVFCADGELLLVMEYVDGESLSQLSRHAPGNVPLAVAVAIVSEMLHGLHAAHEATDEDGAPLGIVHRDVSPQNVLVGADGVARLVDFGVARAAGRLATTVDGDIKGKLAYMAPEQIRRESVTRRADIFAAGVVLWELLTGQRLFASESEGATLEKILVGWVAPPSSVVRDLPPELDAVVLRALDPQPSMRFGSAREMAVALEDAFPRALGRDVSEWVESVGALNLRARRALVAQVEREREEETGRAPASGPRLIAQIPAQAVEGTVELGTRPLMIAFERNEQTVVLPPVAMQAPPRATAASIARKASIFIGSALVVVCGSLYFVRPAPVALPDDPAPMMTTTNGVAPVEATTATTDPTPAPPAATATTAAAKEAPPPAPTVTAKPVVRPVGRRVAPAAQAPAHGPKPSGCTNRYDPVTKKTIYLGDCE